MSKPKYKVGKQVSSIAEFDATSNLYFKWRGRTIHRAALESMQYRVLRGIIEAGYVYVADPIEEKKEAKANV